jgi:hypothetical protein
MAPADYAIVHVISAPANSLIVLQFQSGAESFRIVGRRSMASGHRRESTRGRHLSRYRDTLPNVSNRATATWLERPSWAIAREHH